MSLESVLYTRLTTHSGVAALVGTRVSPLKLDQNTSYPAITYERVASERPLVMGVTSGLVIATIAVNIWARLPDHIVMLAVQVVDALHRWSNISGTVVQHCSLSSELDLYDDEVKIYHHVMDFRIAYEE